jgi:S-DNA-T family DNA segregation ATPase FtsK/SpoIIIE
MPAKKNKSRKQSKPSSSKAAVPPKRREIGALICLFLALFSFLGFFTREGWFIDFFGVFMRGLIGGGFYILVPILLLAACILGFHRGRPVRMRLICALLMPLLFGALLHLLFCETVYEWRWALLGRLYEDGLLVGAKQSGGILGGLLALTLRLLFGKIGSGSVYICAIVFLLFASLNITMSAIADWIKNRPRREYSPAPEPEPKQFVAKPVKQKRAARFFDAEKDDMPAKAEPAKPINSAIDIPVDDPPKLRPEKPSFFDGVPKVKTPDQVFKEVVLNDHLQILSHPADAHPAPPDAKASAPDQPAAQTEQALKQPKPDPKETELVKEEVAKDIAKSLEHDALKYVYPPLDLLSARAPGNILEGREEMALNAKRLSATIKSFGINAQICNVTRGPSVTRYELELEQGIKLNKLTNLADDIALSLGATGVRIAPIPDKISIVGIEVPNKLVNIVCLRDLIESAEFKNHPSRLAFSIGKDIGGNSVVGDISKLPHLLIAGTTGSGKSVCMNSLILSLLYKSSPDDVRLIMIDPKMIELGVYNGIPHLLIPVVTDPKKAAGALQWAVFEMMKRYKLFSEVGARDLKSYNSIIEKKPDGQKLPQGVVLIDALADLMLVAAKEVEESICRVAQMGRASGIHLIIATQRPSADVITGLMKANIPSRIAFAVDSALNSRIILDTTGAEKLVGKGDMLYFPLGSGKPLRVQGTFVTDKEREDVIEYVTQRSSARYSEEIINEIEKAAESKDIPASSSAEKMEKDDGADELLPAAIEVILESGQASVSMLQRRLKLGYSRAARLVIKWRREALSDPLKAQNPVSS